MTTASAAEFLALRESDLVEEYRRAAHEEATIDVWLEIIEEHPEMRFWVACNKSVPLEVLHLLAGDEDPGVRGMVAMKRKLEAGTLAGLASDEDDGVRMAVARHRKTPNAVLRSMVDDDPWHEVRQLAATRLAALADASEVPDDK